MRITIKNGLVKRVKEVILDWDESGLNIDLKNGGTQDVVLTERQPKLDDKIAAAVEEADKKLKERDISQK